MGGPPQHHLGCKKVCSPKRLTRVCAVIYQAVNSHVINPCNKGLSDQGRPTFRRPLKPPINAVLSSLPCTVSRDLLRSIRILVSCDLVQKTCKCRFTAKQNRDFVLRISPKAEQLSVDFGSRSYSVDHTHLQLDTIASGCSGGGRTTLNYAILRG